MAGIQWLSRLLQVEIPVWDGYQILWQSHPIHQIIEHLRQSGISLHEKRAQYFINLVEEVHLPVSEWSLSGIVGGFDATTREEEIIWNLLLSCTQPTQTQRIESKVQSNLLHSTQNQQTKRKYLPLRKSESSIELEENCLPWWSYPQFIIQHQSTNQC